VNLAVPLNRARGQPDTEQFFHSFYYATCWNGGGKKENCGWEWGEGGGGGEL